MSYRPFLFYSKQNFTVILSVVIKAFRPFDLEKPQWRKIAIFYLDIKPNWQNWQAWEQNSRHFHLVAATALVFLYKLAAFARPSKNTPVLPLPYWRESSFSCKNARFIFQCLEFLNFPCLFFSFFFFSIWALSQAHYHRVVNYKKHSRHFSNSRLRVWFTYFDSQIPLGQTDYVDLTIAREIKTCSDKCRN